MGKNKKIRIAHEEVVYRFAEALKALRRSRGMTQLELAGQVGVPESYISKLENALIAPGIDLTMRLANALGATIAELLPASQPPETLTILQAQAQRLFNIILRNADRELLLEVNPYLARIAEAAEKNK